MGEYRVSSLQSESFVREMVGRMAQLAQQLVAWVSEQARTLEEVETQVLPLVKELGAGVVAGLCQVQEPTYAAPTIACDCGQEARYQRQRTVGVKSVLGAVRFQRAYYLCAHCQQGHAPLDRRLEVRAGGLSRGLEELLALVGLHSPFAEAAQLIGRLTLVEVSPTSVREATENLAELARAEDAAQVQALWEHTAPLPEPPAVVPSRLYIAMDGITVLTHEEGWKEVKVGVCYTTRPVSARDRPDSGRIEAEQISYVADLTDAATFGRHLWWESCRRGVLHAREVVVLGDGAAWIWNLADEHFPGATQIVDWYHASQYLWQAAHAIYPASDLAARWAQRALNALWEGKLPTVLANLAKHAAHAEPVQQALTYFTNNQHRMHYDRYRARGLQIGSGTIESTCKHLIAQRFKGAGMIWNRDHLRAMATLRARLKSGRWHATLKLRPAPRRVYQRLQLAA
jgi:hypothetical protein